jgi:hypothetical protein
METKLGPALEFERRSVRIDKRKGASRSILSEECSGASQSLLRHAERVYPTQRPARTGVQAEASAFGEFNPVSLECNSCNVI